MESHTNESRIYNSAINMQCNACVSRDGVRFDFTCTCFRRGRREAVVLRDQTNCKCSHTPNLHNEHITPDSKRNKYIYLYSPWNWSSEPTKFFLTFRQRRPTKSNWHIHNSSGHRMLNRVACQKKESVCVLCGNMLSNVVILEGS